MTDQTLQLPIWDFSPDIALLVVLLAGGYRYVIDRPRNGRRIPGATRSQRWCFYGGVLVLWLAADGPIDQVGETYLFSIHMVQMLLLTLVAPPLLLLGLPAWLLRRVFAVRVFGAAARLVTRPVAAVPLFNAVLLVSAWPPWVDLYLRYDVFHLAVHVLWVSSALAWWWPVLSPLPEWPHVSYPARMFYVFLQSFLPTIPASFLTFGTTVMYPFYENAPRLTALTPLGDQQAAGLIMKIGGGLLLWITIAALFARWSYEANHDAPDWLYARDPTAFTSDQPLRLEHHPTTA